jgi:hypothetical protein
MKQSRKGFHRHALAAAVVLALAGTAVQAQLSTATIKGHVAAAGAGQTVVAVNKDNGHIYKTTTLADGGYVLTGLAPGSYTIRVGTGGGQDVTLAVGETASLDLGGGTQQVTVVGSLQRKDVKNSEASTTVSKRQIETLPQVTRNFLAFADLAPGVRFVADPATGYTRIQGGAQSSDRVNVFIDGMSQKNDLTRGGIAGQNESRGNPFPQSAIAEYKVITQNYKAEYGSVSSTAITAVTKSGTNTTQGDGFFDYAGDSQIAYSPFEKKAATSGQKRPPPKQVQFGASIGGAIVQDRIHYFLSYEGKDNDIPEQQVASNLSGVTVTPWLQSNVLDKQWNAARNFHEDLLFAKLNVALSDDDRLEFSAKVRNEFDKGALTYDDHPDWGFSTATNVLNRKQDETRLAAKWERTGDRWLNEANAELFYTTYEPKTVDMSPFVEYKRMNWSGVMMDGRMEGRSRNKQDSFTLKDDFTYTGKSGHVIKTGASLNQSNYEVGGARFAVPHYFVFITDAGNPGLVGDPGMPGPDANNPVGADKFYPGWEPFSTTGSPAILTKYKNNKLGLYLQDDIAITPNLELNLGVRWDYEDNAYNNKYVTPTWVVNSMNAADTRTGAAPGQTYADSLAKGGINIKDYLSTGKERKAYTGAIQPRLGASWDISGDKSSVVIVGLGRAYDRTPAMKARDELINNSAVSPSGTAWEYWLLNNNMKMPYSDQFGLGLRQAVGQWNTEVNLSQVLGYNEFLWTSGGRNPDGSIPTGGAWFDAAGGAPTGIQKLLLGDTSAKSKTNTLSFKVDKPYTKSSGWGAFGTLTLNSAYTTATDSGAESGDANQYNWAVGKSEASMWRRSIDVERYHVTAGFNADNLLPWDITLGAKVSAGPGTEFWVTSCAAGWGSGCQRYTVPGGAFEQFDLMLSKKVALPMAGSAITFRMDILNLFNKANYGKYDTWGGGPSTPPKNQWGGDNANAGVPMGIVGPMRTVKVGMKIDF